MLVRGRAVVSDASGDAVASVGPGGFLGELQYLEGYPDDAAAAGGDADGAVASAPREKRQRMNVTCAQDCELHAWRADDLATHLESRRDVRHALEALWARTLARKLERMNEAAPAHA